MGSLVLSSGGTASGTVVSSGGVEADVTMLSGGTLVEYGGAIVSAA